MVLYALTDAVSMVPIVFSNTRYMPPALDRRAGACKIMQRGSSTVLLGVGTY
jgi:hypothetical protein